MSLTWSSGPTLNNPRSMLGGSGNLASAISVCGENSGYTQSPISEIFNGFTWANASNLNSARLLNVAGGNPSAAICIGGYTFATNQEVAQTELFNGAAWTNAAALGTPRDSLAGDGTPSAAICMGGSILLIVDTVEGWNGSAWSNKASLANKRQLNAGGGNPSAAFTVGGNYDNDHLAWFEVLILETFNGTTWASGGSLNTGRSSLSGGGTPSDAITMGGAKYDNSSVYSLIELYNGSAWTNSGDLLQTRWNHSGDGNSNQGIVIGGAHNGILGTIELSGSLEDYSANIESNSLISAMIEAEINASLQSLSKIFANAYSWIPGENSAIIQSKSSMLANWTGSTELSANIPSHSSIISEQTKPPLIVPLIKDGLYLIRRSMDLTYCPIKFKHVKGYNDHYLDFLLHGCPVNDEIGWYYIIPVTRKSWEDWDYFNFLQDDEVFDLGCRISWGGDVAGFFFPDPGISSGIITNVSIWGYMRGSGALLYIDSINSFWNFGKVKYNLPFFQWVHADYPTNPETELSWQWSELANGVFCAGLALYSNTNSDDLVREFSRCRYFKVTINYIDIIGNPQVITLWPNADAPIWHDINTGEHYKYRCSTYGGIGPECRSPFMLPNGLNYYWSEPTLLRFLYSNRFITYDCLDDSVIDLFNIALDGPLTPKSTPAFIYCNIPDIPSSLLFNKVTLDCDIDQVSNIGADVTVTPFLLINDIKYYGTGVYVPVHFIGTRIITAGSLNYTWSINPATTQPWTYADLAGLKYGFELTFGSYDQQPTVIINPRISMYLDASLQFSSRHGIYKQSRYGWLCNHAFSDYALPAPIAKLCRNDGTLATKRYGSSLSEIPSSLSTIFQIKVNASFWAFGDREHSGYRLFLYYNGQYYYDGDRRPFDNDPLYKSDVTYTWALSPATGLPWTYEEFQGLIYGIEVSSDSTYDIYTMELLDLSADYIFRELEGPKVEYTPIDAYMLGFTQYAQNPNIRPDDLVFVLPPGGFLPERTEVCYIKYGQMVFHGIVIGVTEIVQSPNSTIKTVQVYAKSQQVMLFYRDLPYFFYNSSADYLDKPVTLNELFSDDIPTYPYFQCWNKFSAFYERNSGDAQYEPSPVGYMLQGGLELLRSIDSKIGLFFFLNSNLAGVSKDSKLTNIKSLVYNRAKFLTNHDPILDNEADYSDTLADWSLDHGSCGLANHGVPEWDGSAFQSGTRFNLDNIGGIRRYRTGDPDIQSNLAIDEYSYSGEDMLTHDWPGSFMILVDHAFPTYLKPGEFEKGDYHLSVPWLFHDVANLAFDKFFLRLGYELQFENLLDGYVYMNAKSEISRDTGRQFIHNIDNAYVIKKIPANPVPNEIVAISAVPQAVSSLERTLTTWITQVVNVQDISGPDLLNYITDLYNDDPAQYTISILAEEWLLRPGDYIWVQAANEGLRKLRTRQVTILKGRSELIAGKRYLALNPQWGAWKKASASKETDHLIQSLAIDFNAPGGSKTFDVLYHEFGTEVKLSLNWTLWVAQGQTAPILSQDIFIVVKVDGFIVTPGRIYCSNTGGTLLDLSRWCPQGATHTIQIIMKNGIAPDSRYGHKISGTINQYAIVEALQNT